MQTPCKCRSSSSTVVSLCSLFFAALLCSVAFTSEPSASSRVALLYLRSLSDSHYSSLSPYVSVALSFSLLRLPKLLNQLDCRRAYRVAPILSYTSSLVAVLTASTLHTLVKDADMFKEDDTSDSEG